MRLADLAGLGIALGVALVVTVSGCSSTVTGEGRPAVDDPTDEPTESTTPTETTATDDQELDCRGQSVSPAGAPYCYTQPAGLDEVDLGEPTAGEEGRFRTSYGFGAADHIDVQAYAVGIDTDELTDEEIIAELSGVVVDLEAGGFEFEDDPESLSVDDARAYAYEGTSTDGAQAITTHFIFRGGNEVQVNCASTDETQVIEAACADVLDSLQIVG